MIRHVYERADKAKSLSEVYVATDDKRIEAVVIGFWRQGNHDFQSGEERDGSLHGSIGKFEKQGKTFDVVINIQGDEPYIHPEQIDLAASCFTDLSKYCHACHKA